jgi:cytochrome c oxidase accessory protein FixG
LKKTNHPATDGNSTFNGVPSNPSPGTALMRNAVPQVSALKTASAGEPIYVRETRGRYTQWRWACVWTTQLVFFGLPWLNWNERQILFFDLAARKFYVFGLVLWPQDLIYLAAVLIISAFALLLSSTLRDRVWCGFACPHTVYTEIFMWVERQIEGSRSARIRLDKQARSLSKFTKKTLKHGVWALAAAWTGFTFVGYFTPVRLLLDEALTMTLGPWEWFGISLYSLLTYCNAGWMREQFCRHICPHARFQAAMVDRDTLVIRYDAARGEPRGLRNRKHLLENQQQGDCIDCTLCVQVCPTGSDIRQGFHHECTGCAACIDACNLVMDKIGMARGLIRYTSANAMANRPSSQRIWRNTFRPRVVFYLAGLLTTIVALVGFLMLRVPLKLGVDLDRSVMLRKVDRAMVENVYRLHIMNTDERPHQYKILVSGIDAIALATPAVVNLDGNSSRAVTVRVRAEPENASAGPNAIMFEVKAQDDAKLRVGREAIFLMPRDDFGQKRPLKREPA